VIRELVRRALMLAQQPLESYLLGRASSRLAVPPCFIIGAPRSGTTLIYEALLVKYNFSYFSNLADRFYNVPAASTYLGRRVISVKKIGSFSSKYGQLEGWAAPSEGGRIWNRWISQPYHLMRDYSDSLPVDEIRNTISAITALLNAPLLNKNVMHSVHIELLDELFPDCIFIEIRRDPLANIRSILRAREKKGGPTERNSWWSVKPFLWEKYQASCVEKQACVQVCGLRNDIIKQMKKISPSRVHVVQYEDFCEQPSDMLFEIKQFIEKHHDIVLQERGDVPKEFIVSPSISFSSEVEAEIAALMASHCLEKCDLK